jgi:ribosome maturation factor RimP
MFGSAVSLPTKTRPIGLWREFRGHLVKPGDETVTLFADGRAVEIPVF